jgi:glycerol-3-phosphate acyltransferase PlsY
LGQAQAAELYLLLAVLIVLKHAGNIRRLLQGSEAKFSPRGSK